MKIAYLGVAAPLPLVSNTEGDLCALVIDDYLRPEVGAFVRDNQSVLLVLTNGQELRVGPLLSTSGSICYDCFRFYVSLRTGLTGARCQYPEKAIAAIKTLTQDQDSLLSSIAILDLRNGKESRARYRSRGDCPACRQVDLDFESNLQILGHPETGIIARSRTEKIPGTSLFTSLGSVLIPEEIRLDRTARLSAVGKGRSHGEAERASTLEAAERYSTLFQATEHLLLGDVKEMASYPLQSLLQYSKTQYCSGVVLPIDNTQQMLWAPARSLLDRATVAIPAAYAYLDYVFEIEPIYYFADTNGCAAGASIELAISSALLELIERDALAIWWYNRIPLPELTFAKGDLPALDEASGALTAAGRNLRLFNLTNDLGVPVVAATSALYDGTAIYLGAAADLNLRRAALRAVEEMLQFWFWDKMQNRVPESRSRWLQEGSYSTFPFLAPAQQNRATESSLKRSIAETLESHGLKAAWLDLTRPELSVPVVRVIVPGLRHYARRFGHGRLYTVPIELGWLPTCKAEAEMNPYTIPL